MWDMHKECILNFSDCMWIYVLLPVKHKTDTLGWIYRRAKVYLKELQLFYRIVEKVLSEYSNFCWLNKIHHLYHLGVNNSSVGCNRALATGLKHFYEDRLRMGCSTWRREGFRDTLYEPSKRLDRDFSIGHVVIGQQGMAFSWRRAGVD